MTGRAESDALVDAAGARVVLEDIEPEPLRAPFIEDERADRKHRFAAEPSARRIHHDAKQPNAAGAVPEPREEREADERARAVLDPEVPDVGIGHARAVLRLGMAADEGPVFRPTLELGDRPDVVGARGREPDRAHMNLFRMPRIERRGSLIAG